MNDQRSEPRGNDQSFDDKALADAEQDVEGADKLVRGPEAKIASMRAAGLNTRDAEDLLRAYRYGAEMAAKHRDALAGKRSK